MRREFVLVLLAGAVGAGLVVLAARQAWAHAIFTPPRPLPAQDIAVTGFNDFPFASMLDTPLTTARIPLRDIAGRLFTRALHEIGGGPDQPGQLVIAPLVVRSSA